MAEVVLSDVVRVAQERTQAYLPAIDTQRSNCLTITAIPQDVMPHIKMTVGKVRDIYECANTMVLITTDRQSAFDRNLASIPFKGQVLNLTSQWWFSQTQHIIRNHIIGCPHPNTTVGRKCTVFSVEFVMRGYITGSTNTSLWTHYSNGVREYCGHHIPDGLVKNQKLERNLLTPTTKDDKHDELISAEEVVAQGRMTQEEWDTCAEAAQALFAFGQEIAAKRGLILVDTKYEFGKDADGNITLLDEIHTPDSRRVLKLL
jgi:phosphoribosylaminoimidazole-succinocarboxamide synthase